MALLDLSDGISNSAPENENHLRIGLLPHPDSRRESQFRHFNVGRPPLDIKVHQQPDVDGDQRSARAAKAAFLGQASTQANVTAKMQ
ncbi:hypothetical protein [Burkholderia diffusa]|uniref:hypothetical protein n=1 Tax=Burkholderia diffusa TaxID=488732 RepID=UPI002AB207DE|nr:hypothetical protein [Burkholderia diffusa]